MSQLQVPANVSSITISGTAYTPVNNIVTGESDADDTLLTDPYTRPKLITTNISTGAGTVSFPSNVSSITVSSTVYTPDASGYIYNLPANDTTLLTDTVYGFILTDS